MLVNFLLLLAEMKGSFIYFSRCTDLEYKPPIRNDIDRDLLEIKYDMYIDANIE